MDALAKELIAIGASVSAHCQPCLDYHLGKARELGVNENDIEAAIGVGYMVEKGASTAMRSYVSLVFNRESQSGACCSDGNSGCCG